MMTRYKSAFAVPSGFAVAARTATKGKTAAAQDATPVSTSSSKVAGRSRQASAAAVAPVLAA